MYQQRWRQVAKTRRRIGAAQQQQFTIGGEDGCATVSRDDGWGVWQNDG
jgi:hypothetical protein